MLLTGALVAYALYSSYKTRRVSQFEAAKAQARNYSEEIATFISEKAGELKSLKNSMEVGNNVNVNFVNAARADKPYLTEPHELNGKKIITINYPFIIDGKFAGMAGLNLEQETIQKELLNGMRNDSMHAYVVFVPNSSLPADLQTAMNNGEERVIIQKSNVTGDLSVMAYVPLPAKGFDAPWAVGYIVSDDILRSEELGVRYRTLSQLLFIDILWGLFLLWLMSRVFRPLTNAVKLLGKMTEGEGDLTIRLEDRGKDEIGQMSKSLNRFIEKLHSTIKRTQKDSKSLLGTSSALYTLSGNLSHSSETSLVQSESASKATGTASENAKTIAGDARRTSANANELASTAEQMSMNMNSVASAVEELSASFAEITGNTDESHAIASDATKKSSEATKVMNELGTAAKEIGHVTEIIKRIADKTNLLALNATIEAASAGAAGKGFAVVAGEIKELANQSAQSADDIARRIDGIQVGTNNAVEVISSVSEIINKINSSVDEIAGSVRQQTEASNEIANNAGQANAGARQLAGSISEIVQAARASAQNAESVAQGTRSVSESVGVMYEGAKKSNLNSAELNKTADKLKHMAEHLDSIVSKFKT
ncbi:MAG: methyl-accepting chemotaxis protein [Fibromonadaceae bacterium]|nr:methyl-accepting chemotaxis protein [Fibromonadaceae bacterium]